MMKKENCCPSTSLEANQQKIIFHCKFLKSLMHCFEGIVIFWDYMSEKTLQLLQWFTVLYFDHMESEALMRVVRVEITLVCVGITLVRVGITLRIVITLERVEIILLSIKFTLCV
jgi:hypothetical protein